MGCLFDSRDVNVSSSDLDVLDVGTGVLFKDTIRDVWDMGNVRCPSREGYSIAPLFNIGQDAVETDDRVSVVPMEQDVEFVFNVDSEVLGRGVLVMKKQEPNEPTRRVAFHDMEFNLLHQGTMFIELGNMRKLKLKFKPPPVYGVEQKKYWVLILLQKDARNFMSVGSQPRTHMYATNPIPEEFLGQNEIIIENIPPKPKTWKGGPLPPGWIQETDQSNGQYFFVNTTNGEVSWSPPLITLPQRPKQKYKYPKDPELDQLSECVVWNGSDTRQLNFRNCNRICVCQLGTLFVVSGSNITGKWIVARRGLKLTWNNYSGRGDPKYNKITTSMASLPELLMGPPPAPIGQPIQGVGAPIGQPIQGVVAPIGQPMQGAGAPIGQPIQGASAPYQDPNAIGHQPVGPSYGAQPQAGGPHGYQPPPQIGGLSGWQPPHAVGYQPDNHQPHEQEIIPEYAVGAPPTGSAYQPPSYGVSGGPYSQPQYGQPQYSQPQYGQPQHGQAYPGGYQQPTFQPMATPEGGWAPPNEPPPERSDKKMKIAAAAVGGALVVGSGMYLAHEWMEYQEEEERRRQKKMFKVFSKNMNDNRLREKKEMAERLWIAEAQLDETRQQNEQLRDDFQEEKAVGALPVDLGGMEMEEYDEDEESDVEIEAEEAPEDETKEAPEEEEIPQEEVVEDAPEDGEEKGPQENEEAEEYMAAGAGAWDFDDPPSDGEGKKIQNQQKDQVQVFVTHTINASNDVAIDVIKQVVITNSSKASNEFAIEVVKSKNERIQEYMDKNAFWKQKYQACSFYLHTAKEVGKNAIGIVTQLSMDRLPMLKAMICSWDGYISAAVYITNKEEDLPKLKELFYYAENEMITALDLHLLFSSNKGDSYYPINNLRNLALKEVRSKYVFLLDVDFTISAALDVDVTIEMKEMLNSGQKALVVPALEPIGCYGRAGEDLWPHDIDICRKQGTVCAFHIKHFKAGHWATDLDRWVKATAPYGVQFEHCYEPYVIMRRDQVPEYDERFRGYGMNKISHIMEVSTNTEFHVLPNVYVMSIRHEKSEDWKKTYRDKKKRERVIEMQALFNIFKNELFNKAERQGGKKKNGNKYFDILATAARVVSFIALVAIGKSIITA